MNLRQPSRKWARMTVLAPLYQHDPKQVAVRIGETAIPYGRFTADIDAMAAWYAGQGLKPGARIAVFPRSPVGPNYWDWIMLLGAMRAGLVHATGRLPDETEASGGAGPLVAAVGDPDKLATFEGAERQLPFQPHGEAPLAEQVEIAGKPPKLTVAAKAVRLFKTSGTTGTPKVVAWDDKTMALRLAEVRSTSGLGPQNKLFNFLGLITTTSLRHSLGAWQMGCEVMLTAIGDSEAQVGPAIAACDHMVTSPFRLGKMLEMIPGPIVGHKNRTIELLGGRIPKEVREGALERLCSQLRNLYGSTEAGMVAYGNAELALRHPGAVGFAVDGATIEIVDDAGNPLPRGENGTVRLRTKSMAKTYYGSGDPLLRDGWFYPGDLGRIEDDGLFVVIGRSGDTINVGGATIAVAPFEQKIRELEGVDEACLLEIPGSRADLVTVAVSCPKSVDLNRLRQSLRPILPAGFRIELCRVPDMPRNEMGKVVRRDLAARIARQRAIQRQA